MDLHSLTTFVKPILFIMIISHASCQHIDDENICRGYAGNVVIANPNDCFSFYTCRYGNAMKIICPESVMFNPKLGNCDVTYSDCIIEDESLNVVTVKTDLTDLLSEDMEPDGEGEDTNVTGGEIEEIEITNSDTDVTGDTENKEDIEESELESSSITPLTTNQPSDSTTVLNTVSSTEDPSNCESCSTSNPLFVQCPLNDTDTPSFLASDSFCDSFYLCYHGRPFEMFCPSGFHWSQDQKKCILERESDCTDSTVHNTVPKCPLNGQFFIPHSERCNLFYYCENGIRSVQQCSAFKQWDVVEKTCIFDIHAKCIKTIPRSQRAKYYNLEII